MKLVEGELIPLNGYVLIEPIFDDIKTTLFLPEHLKKEKVTMKGKVIKAGSLVKYKNSEHYAEDTDEIKDGDIVIFRQGSDVKIEDDLHRKTEQVLCAIQRKRILAIIEE
jgi:co-chaperonin GroES (HSP10)